MCGYNVNASTHQKLNSFLLFLFDVHKTAEMLTESTPAPTKPEKQEQG